MATQVQFRRGTTGQHSAFTGAVGEVTVDTEKRTVCIHDATQAGGFPLLKEDASNSNLALGSLSSCALKFAGDPDTGIISPGANQLDSSGAITIPNNGNVSISGDLTVTGSIDSGNQLALILALG